MNSLKTLKQEYKLLHVHIAMNFIKNSHILWTKSQPWQNNQSLRKQDCVAFMSQPYWIEIKVEVELRLILMLMLIWGRGWSEVESKFISNWVEVELSWGKDKLTLCSRTTYVFNVSFNVAYFFAPKSQQELPLN